MKSVYEKLIKEARAAQKRSYSPYSRFKVGAALLTAGGKIFLGTNIENCSYGLTLCAERLAAYKAISEGQNKFKAIAIVSSGKGCCYPCGACLQVLSEFTADMDVILAAGSKTKIFRLKDLLPNNFKCEK